MNWYYIDGPRRVGPLNETAWAELVRTGIIQPDTLVWHEGMEKWTPYREVQAQEEPEMEMHNAPGFEDSPNEGVEDPEAFAARMLDLDYEVNLGDCVSRAWETYKSAFWMLVGAAFIAWLIMWVTSMVPIAGYAVPLALKGVMLGGMYLIFLRIMRGEFTSFNDLFAGFQMPFFAQLALKTLIAFLVVVACFIPWGVATAMLNIIPENYMALASTNPQEAARLLQESLTAMDPQKIMVWLLVFLTCSMPAVYFAFCWMFAIPLIVDKRMHFWSAMQLSRRKVLQHPWKVAVVSVVAGLIGYVGLVACCFGIFFTLPLYFLTMLYLYEDMFNPPTPKA